MLLKVSDHALLLGVLLHFACSLWLHKVLAPLVLGENGKMVLYILLGGGVNAEYPTQKYKLLVSILPFNQLCNHRETNRGSPFSLPVLIQV